MRADAETLVQMSAASAPFLIGRIRCANYLIPAARLPVSLGGGSAVLFNARAKLVKLVGQREIGDERKAAPIVIIIPLPVFFECF